MMVTGKDDLATTGALANILYRATFDKHGRRVYKPAIREALTRARRFTLDASMSAYMADLGWAAYQAKPDQRTQIADSVRRMARLPHRVTWIEWDEKALATRARDEYGSALQPESVPLRSGWLMMQHPQIDTAFYALSFGISTQHVGRDGMIEEMGGPTLGTCPFGIMWRTDDVIQFPWKTLRAANDIQNLRRIPQSGFLTGIPNFNAPIAVADASEYLTDPFMTNVSFRRLFEEQWGMARYILGLLATLNDIPLSAKEVTVAKGFVARGNYRKYLSHTTLTLNVPTKRYKAMARHAVTIMRRKAHGVRGHWREHWQHPPRPDCEHIWKQMEERADATVMQCEHCKGRKTWITEHQRGDATLGFITHDYTVKHDTGN